MSSQVHPGQSEYVYKLIPLHIWPDLLAQQYIPASALDKTDGFIHLSSEETYMETANIHYTDYNHILLIKTAINKLQGDLRWEAARKRNNILFPHLYGSIPAMAIIEIRSLLKGGDDCFFDAGLYGEAYREDKKTLIFHEIAS